MKWLSENRSKKTVRIVAYLCAGLGNGTQIVDHVGLRHTDTGITESEDMVLFVGNNTNVKLLFGIEDGRIG